MKHEADAQTSLGVCMCTLVQLFHWSENYCRVFAIRFHFVCMKQGVEVRCSNSLFDSFVCTRQVCKLALGLLNIHARCIDITHQCC